MPNKETIINIICGVLLIALIVALIICFMNKDSMKNMENMENNNNQNQNKSTICIFIDNPNCGFSKKMKALLESNGMKIGNMNVEIKNIMTDGAQLSKEHGINGTPGFICFRIDNKTGKRIVKTSMGYKSLDVLEKELNGDDEENNNNNSGREVVICGRESCPFCVRMYAFLDKNNIKHRKVASDSSEGQDLTSKTGATGVPLCLILMNGQILKHKVGYHEDLSFFA
jgi:glutaredoxin